MPLVREHCQLSRTRNSNTKMVHLYGLLGSVLILMGCAVASPQKQFAFKTGSKMEVLFPRFDEDVLFKCETNDASSDVTLWHSVTPFKEKMLIPNLGERFRFKVHITGSSDGGPYLCKAVNSKGQKIMKVFLVVIDTSRISLKIEPQRSQIVSPGDSASFTCTGTPGQMTWYKVEERVVAGKRQLVIIKIMPGKTERFGKNKVRRRLSFESVQKSDSGLYECQLVDRHMKRRMIARLSVRSAPQIVHDGPSTLQLHEGNSAILPCRVSGTPRPRINWSKNGRPISFVNPHYIKRENGLNIKQAHFPEDDGMYVCEAENELGRDTITRNVVVKVAPKMGGGMETEYVRRGRNPLSIECLVNRSFPQPQFTWKYRFGVRKSGGWKPLPRQIQKGVSTKGPLKSVLHISQKIRLPPAGVTFRCEASNAEGKGVQEFTVHQV